MRFPPVHGANLEGRVFTLPDEFDGDLDLVLMAFQRRQQIDVDTWVPAAKAEMKRYPLLRYYELPIISRRLPFARWWLDGAMRAGIADRAAREITSTLYLDKAAFRRQLELPTEGTIYAVLVTCEGQVLSRAERAWSPEAGSSLEAVLSHGSVAPATENRSGKRRPVGKSEETSGWTFAGVLGARSYEQRTTCFGDRSHRLRGREAGPPPS
jgi:hypothetical protein